MPTSAPLGEKPATPRDTRTGDLVLAAAAYVAYHFTGGNPAAAGCTVRADGDTVELTQDQASNAATIAAVGTSRGCPSGPSR